MPSLEGWDTAAVAPLSFINLGLGPRSAEVLSTFTIQGGNAHGAPRPYTAQGTIGPLGIRPSTQANLLLLYFQIVEGVYTSEDGATLDLLNVGLEMAISLEFLALSGAESLTMDLSQAGLLGDPPQPGKVTPMIIEGPVDVLNDLGLDGQRDLQNQMAQVVADHAAPLNAVLATLLVSGEPWLQTTSSAYTSLTAANYAGYLAILAMLDGHTKPNATTLEASFLPGASGSNSTTVLSGNTFLQYVIMPQLPASFQGHLSADNLQFDRNNSRITVRHSFNLSEVKVGSINYTPVIDEMIVNNGHNVVSISLNGHCDLYMGINMTFSYQASLPLLFSEAKQQLSFASDPFPIVHHDAEIPWWWAAGGPIVYSVTDAIVSVISSDIQDDLVGLLNKLGLSAIQTNVGWSQSQSSHAVGVTLNTDLLTFANL
ncbi:TULIP family P47-like protein [Deinococcus sp. HMF7604]|uniref:TULIP family P47-like protein n=1 Tax=Deinococcus betulae TaxID=2873312 RepID=UPI001CCCF1A6|nr:TULIP family P47-like protein [Deinococcus betulae]MBZ9753461.1 TULIP family P47-like protein [Deinococcus betulae]